MGWVRAPLWPDKQVRTRYRGDVGVVEEREVAVVVASEKRIVVEGACDVVEDIGVEEVGAVVGIVGAGVVVIVVNEVVGA